MTISLPWGVRTPEKSESFFFFDRCSAAHSHRDRLVDKKGCDTTREMTTAVSQGGPRPGLRVARIGNSVSVLPATPFLGRGHAPQLNQQWDEHTKGGATLRQGPRSVTSYLAGFSYTIAQMQPLAPAFMSLTQPKGKPITPLTNLAWFVSLGVRGVRGTRAFTSR